jgi:hypothetical protein
MDEGEDAMPPSLPDENSWKRQVALSQEPSNR